MSWSTGYLWRQWLVKVSTLSSGGQGKGGLKDGPGPPLDLWNNRNKQVSYKRTQSRSALVMLNCVLVLPHLTHRNRQCPCPFSVILESMHEASGRPLTGTVSAQKALLRSDLRQRLGSCFEEWMRKVLS